ncbi:MAG: DUF4365 domain-containing protein [Pseudonocardiales bacterium]|nr:DUF4365 domain-containing protein [Pseudonocardiales bacterium]
MVRAGKEPGPGGWWIRPDAEHVRYWTNHSLPIVVVLYRPETKRCHRQLVSHETLIETSTCSWKLLVPEAHNLDESAAAPLREAAEGDPYVLHVRELQLARRWMELLAGPRGSGWSSTSRSGSIGLRVVARSRWAWTTRTSRDRRSWQAGCVPRTIQLRRGRTAAVRVGGGQRARGDI